MMELNHEKLWKRLLAAMNMGIYLVGRDGHIWIETDSDLNYSFYDILLSQGIYLNNKIYGGILEALDTIDGALKMAGKPSLLELYNPSILFLGNRFGPDRSRLKEVKKGCGGVF